MLTISKIQEKQNKLVEIYKEFQSSSECSLRQGFSESCEGILVPGLFELRTPSDSLRSSTEHFRLKPAKSYEIDTSIFEVELIINMEKNAKIVIEDLQKKNSDLKKIKLLFFDVENKISLYIKSINEKDLDLDRKDAF